MALRTKDFLVKSDLDLSLACQHVRELVGSGDVEEALDALLEITGTDHAQLGEKLIVLKSRMAGVKERENSGTLSWGDANVERTRVTTQLVVLIESLNRRPREQALDRKLQPKELRARREYLDALAHDIANRLKVSIHNARLIDLGLQDTPSAVALPWMFKDTETQHTFTSYEEALEIYKRRILVLGAPGSGKTVTLLHIAQKLIAEAERDPSSPIPLVANLSKLDIRSSSRNVGWPLRTARAEPTQESKQIERWLQRELSAYPFIPSEMAGAWIAEGRIAALLDGLDEVDDAYRADLAALLNATYLRDHPSSVVVLCSRINEYRPIQEDKATTLQLPGSITLQPLTRVQIAEYLDSAGAVGLRNALVEDETLYQIAEKPLMLSMLTLAYSGVEPKDIPSSGSLIERRHQLMEKYVERMLQRRARRSKGIQFDNNPRNDVPVREYLYSPNQLNRYLGWLAVRLSVRMQTAVSTPRLFSFLQRQLDRDEQHRVWWALVLCRAPLPFALAVLAGMIIAPLTTATWQFIALVGLFSMFSYVTGAWVQRGGKPPLSGEKPQWSFVGSASSIVRNIIDTVAPTIATIGLYGAFALCSIALSLKLPGNIPPLPAIIQAGCLLTFVIAAAKAISEYPEKDTKRHIFLAGTLSVFLILLALRYQGAIDWYAVAGGVAGYQIIYRAATVWKQEGWRHTVSELFLLVLFVPLIILPSNVFAFTWLPAFAVFNVIAVATLLFFDRSFLPLAGLVIAFAAGKVAGGNAGAAVGVLIFLAAAIVVEAVRPYSVQEKPEGIIEDLERTAEDIGERYCLNPTLFHILAFMRSLPLRFNSFSRYSIDSLLLKRSGSDIEFMHRLLRDYFALRDLQPLFRSGNVPLRLQAVRSLGFQGDAAVGALGEFVRDEDPDTREAAAWALGRIASPETVQHIDAALDDEVERVRATAVSSTRNMIGADCSRLLSSIVDDSSLLVQRALIIRAFQESYFYTLFRIYDADSYVEKVMKNVERRDELRNIVFELISAKSDYRITAGAIRAAEKLKDSRAVPAIIEVLRSSASLREDAAEALGNIGDPRATKALKRAIYDRDKTVREAARSALLQLGVTEIEDSRWGFFSRFFRSALPERADDTSP